MFLAFSPAATTPAAPTILLTVDPLVTAAATASLALGPVSKSPHNPLMEEDEPWEAAWWNTNPSLFYKDNAFHLYYTSNIICGDQTHQGMCPHYGWSGPVPSGPHTTGLLYANSTDGLTWHKPALGLVAAPPNGSTANNIVLHAGLGNGVFYDNHAEAYRQFGHAPAHDCPTPTGYGLAVSTSADGLHNWSACTSAAAMGAKGDTTNNALWDEAEQAYLAFTRIDVHHGAFSYPFPGLGPPSGSPAGAFACAPRASSLPPLLPCSVAGGALGMRREARSVSADFRSWSRAEQARPLLCTAAPPEAPRPPLDLPHSAAPLSSSSPSSLPPPWRIGWPRSSPRSRPLLVLGRCCTARRTTRCTRSYPLRRRRARGRASTLASACSTHADARPRTADCSRL